jgi:hypothetical protein
MVAGSAAISSVCRGHSAGLLGDLANIVNQISNFHYRVLNATGNEARGLLGCRLGKWITTSRNSSQMAMRSSSDRGSTVPKKTQELQQEWL